MTEPKHPQCEFDFEQYQKPRRASSTFAGQVQLLAELCEQGFLQSSRQPMPEPLRKVLSGEPILSTDSAERKNTPMFSGLLAYFPLALAAVARHSKRGNDKHNPGQPLHWAREKSTDHMDCIIRHSVDVEHFNEELQEYEEACALAWRGLANLELLEEKRLARARSKK